MTEMANSMAMAIGAENLGELARSEMDAARRDPRLDRGRGAMVADFWNAIEEAERVRVFSILGLHELQGALERSEARLGAHRDDPELDAGTAQELQVAWERSEMARVEIENDHPHQNAQALIAMNSALDAMVEEFVEAMRGMQAKFISDKLIAAAESKVPEAVEQLSDELRAVLAEKSEELVKKRLPKVSRLSGSGIGRYEKPLGELGLGAPEDRPIPADLDQALCELGAIRDVLIHRAGRVDRRALDQAPTLVFKDGELVRVNRAQYRMYSAAIACYAKEIFFRSIRSWPEVSDDEDGPDLAGWRGYCKIGA